MSDDIKDAADPTPPPGTPTPPTCAAPAPHPSTAQNLLEVVSEGQSPEGGLEIPGVFLR